MIRTLAATLATTTCIVALATPAAAQTREFNIPAGPMRTALDAFARQSGRQVIYRADVQSAKSSGVSGSHTSEDALNAILAGSGFVVRIDRSGAFAIVKAGGNVSTAAGNVTSSEDASMSLARRGSDLSESAADILVTGSRIKGAVTASPRVTITGDQIREEGRSDLGQVIREIPQNFSGGQNPGVLASVGGANPENANVGGGSAFNLRGLGPGATLTLLNGKRLSYSGVNNAIDISALPVAAVDRLDIVTDGASAIYGSDAVAGVANIILRRDYEGLTAALRGGTKTRGGGSEYQLSLTGGTKWQNGSVLLAYDRGHSDAIFGRDRTYVVGLADPTSLYPEAGHDSILLSGHQRLASRVTFNLDALYTRRTHETFVTSGATIANSKAEVRAFTISPSLDINIFDQWTARLVGTYGRDRNQFISQNTNSLTQAITSRSVGCFCNTTQIGEIGFEGPLFQLPGGEIRIATGGGYRHNLYRYNRTSLSGSQTEYGGTDASSYVYGEINIPLVSPSMHVTAVNRLALSAAVRYEKYKRIPGTGTPKIGLVYEPTADISVKSSWGRSFKASTLNQQVQPGYGQLSLVSNLGGSGYAPGAVAIFLNGPNPNLRPERAESRTATIEIHPARFPGLNLEFNYFNVDYTDRIVAPVSSLFTALSEPAYAPFVTRSPTAGQISAALASAGPSFFYNTPGDPYAAVAIIDSSLTNASTDHVSGYDISGSYRFAVGGGNATIRGSGSWIRGRRQLLEGSPALQTAGNLFNPPSFHGRAGVTWDNGGFGLAAFVNHLDGVFANYFVVKQGKTGSFNTVDLNLRYAFSDRHGVLSGFELAFTTNNLLDAKPPLYQVSVVGLPNYDSTNYSSIGRTVAFTATKKW